MHKRGALYRWLLHEFPFVKNEKSDRVPSETRSEQQQCFGAVRQWRKKDSTLLQGSNVFDDWEISGVQAFLWSHSHETCWPGWLHVRSQWLREAWETLLLHFCARWQRRLYLQKPFRNFREAKSWRPCAAAHSSRQNWGWRRSKKSEIQVPFSN